MPYMIAAALTAALGVAGATWLGAWRFDSLALALAWGLVVALANASVRPLAILARFPLTVFTLGLLLLATNAVLLGLAPLLVPGLKLSIPALALGLGGAVAIANAAWAGKLG